MSLMLTGRLPQLMDLIGATSTESIVPVKKKTKKKKVWYKTMTPERTYLHNMQLRRDAGAHDAGRQQIVHFGILVYLSLFT